MAKQSKNEVPLGDRLLLKLTILVRLNTIVISNSFGTA
ncbi:hypothetical protein D082_17920 [Synechocystis sp. PCC 6714]|nr:hypothetical protein D082_17920 [Synechocystis sp. PCC 6714]